MCGIIGTIGNGAAAPKILAGLKRLEYRGYDSAGMATLSQSATGWHIDRQRAAGKLKNLEATVEASPLLGNVGIGHTRWATHGAPTDENAHPHISRDVAVVHNGIIENFDELKSDLVKRGVSFASDTDTEVIAHLLQEAYEQTNDPAAATKTVLPKLKGAYSLAILFKNHADTIVGARRGPPLAVGFGDETTDGSKREMYLGSDALALSLWTKQVCFLEEGDWVVLRPGEARIFDQDNQPANRKIIFSNISSGSVDKGNYRHYMEKEIHEQPQAIHQTLQAYLHPTTKEIALENLNVDFGALKRLTIIACGTSYYAGMTAKYWFEQIARLPVECDVASEYRYREAPIGPGEAALFISQSGETSDTLAALRYCKEQGATIIGIVNVPESSIARESHLALHTLAGPEIGVASTKAMSTQMVLLGLLTLQAAQQRKAIDATQMRSLLDSLVSLPTRIESVLSDTGKFAELGRGLSEARDILFLGRGSLYPIALEGALKLKEISYIHAEGYAAGEMKHGPIALIDEHVPIIVAAPSGALFEKTASNCEEAIARGGRCMLLSDRDGINRLADKTETAIALPQVDSFVAPILYVVPMQLLAYYTAVAKGTDVDQPRNLAKSVTVE